MPHHHIVFHARPDYLAWGWRADILLVLGMFGLLYSLGWWRLRRKGVQSATIWRLTSHWGGQLFLFAALISPIDSLQAVLFSAHMTQHILLTMFAPPLLWLANPYPFLLWGLPRKVRLSVRHLMSGKANFRRVMRQATQPFVAWLLYACLMWGWHDPILYSVAIEIEWLHDMEHISFFGSAMLFWWHVVNTGPLIHGRHKDAMKILYVLGAVFASLGPAVAITFSSTIIYQHYLMVHHDFALTTLNDQRIGGLIMWIPGGMMYMFAALILFINIPKE